MDRRVLEARAAAVVERVLRRLPRRTTLALGRGLGRLLGDLDRRHLAIAAANLRQAFPEWEAARTLRTARAVYAHFGSVLLDILWLRSRTPEKIRSLLEVNGREHVERVMAAGRGAVLVTAHIGNWELHGVAHGLLFGPIHVVARPLDNPELDRRLCAMRTMGGNAVVYKRRALPLILRALRENRGVALLIDQNVLAGDGIFVDFFGRKAATTTVAAALAVKTGSAVVPCRSELLRDGRYRLRYAPALEWTPSGDRQRDIACLTQRLTRQLEDWVRETPEQWLWMHRRWKTRPPEETA
ncbi:MAG TPA: lysophospholipid acyltransferase family protein [Vicinamibacteria bacterium]|nr:lysophospholipid acyltransferase family protein [Vicinamibacteria bacterium]